MIVEAVAYIQGNLEVLFLFLVVYVPVSGGSVC